MAKRGAIKSRPATIAAWGWYGILLVPAADAPGGSFTGTIVRPAPARAFWCTWWSEDPRRSVSAEPDDFGFVDGANVVDQAVGAAYDSLRRGRGPRVYDVSVGEMIARMAYRAGAPTRRSVAVDFEQRAAKGRDLLGLGPEPSVAEVKAAYRREAKRAHPDQGGNAEEFRELHEAYKAVLASAKRREEARVLADVARGKQPVRKPRKPKKRASGADEMW